MDNKFIIEYLSDLPNRVNQNTDVVSELEERELIADKTICVMKKMLPDILKDLASIKDYRKKNLKYSLVMLKFVMARPDWQTKESK